VVIWAVVAATVLSLVAELLRVDRVQKAQELLAVPTMLASGVLSGVSGTSGPLKGIAVRSLRLPRLEHVGLASCVSLVADALKVELFAIAGIFESIDLTVVLLAMPVMPVAAWIGRAVNRRIDEAAFRWIFWTVVGGYTLRMVGVWF